MFLLPLVAAVLLPPIAASPHPKRATTLIPSTVFDSTASLEQYFSYNYPWGTTLNGGARMDKAHVSISIPGILSLTAQPASGQPPATHGGQTIPIHYLSGTVSAKQHFAVPKAGGLVFSAEFLAPTTKGTWPAFWLTAVSGWPPEVDMAEWKGDGKISFNTFNTSSKVQIRDVAYPNPGQWHGVKCQLKDDGGGVVQVKYWMDGTEVTTQYGADYVGKELYLIINLQMEGSSGTPGPTTNTVFSVRNLEVTTL